MLQIVNFLFAIKLSSDLKKIILNIPFSPFRYSTMETMTITPFVRKITHIKTYNFKVKSRMCQGYICEAEPVLGGARYNAVNLQCVFMCT